MTTPSNLNAASGPGWMGHPRPLARLFTIEMWERFGYYGMRALLTLYLTKHFLLGDRASTGLYGGYSALVYLTPLVGGLIADQYLGSKRAVKFGAVLMAIGYFTLAFGGRPAQAVISFAGQDHAVTVTQFRDGPTTSANEQRQISHNGQTLRLSGQDDGSLQLIATNGQIAQTLPRGAFAERSEADPVRLAGLVGGLYHCRGGHGGLVAVAPF